MSGRNDRAEQRLKVTRTGQIPALHEALGPVLSHVENEPYETAIGLSDV